ncbi:WRKY transcription factor [Actinidia chinensis var. chinensis]|uniref:WRKY transcription factor n=1 Tax=Actinidia chinensis var. chinensis TaxID=1590841 RepID=A0A2R6QJE6_ACTCC|nr:WRKY transcription factor [Actinidia chinensis var. chinensis]
MTSSSGSLDTSGNSHPQPPPPSHFSFMSSSANNTSFSDLLAGDYPSAAPVSRGLSDRIAERSGSGVPKFKSITPPSLPISPPPISPFSYFAIPPGLSPAELLDSPVLLSTSNVLPSPTTGSFPTHAFNWKSNSNHYHNQRSVKQEQKNFSDFSFHSQKGPPTSSATSFQSQVPAENKTWGFQETTKQVKPESASMQSFSPEISTIQNNSQSGFQSDYNNHYNQSSQSIREQRRSEDGYNWRKYGQKQVKGSENPRSYYKCTFQNCPTKKKVERSLDGQITEIVYKGNHNHPKPQSTRRSAAAASSQAIQPHTNEIPDQSYASHGNGPMDSVATPEISSISMGDDDYDQNSQKSKSGGDEFDEEEPDAKRWKIEGESEGISAPGSRTVREPRVVVQTTSDIDILDDGYRWRKYGQKVVKGNPNPRSYYKCTNPGCPVRKHVERASHDLRAVITTYEGKHNHDVPAARGSGSHSVNRPLPTATTTNHHQHQQATAIRPSPMFHHSSTHAMANPIRNSRLQAPDQGQAPFTLEMLQSPGSFGFSGFENSMGSYMNQNQLADNVFSRTKEEPRDDLFVESLLY